MDRAEELRDFVAVWHKGQPGGFDQNNLFGPGRLEGDDADEFLLDFARRFSVDLSDFRDYLHYDADEPPIHRRAWGEAPDGTRLDYIPIGLSDLTDAAEAQRWIMAYPPHRVVEVGLLGVAGRGFMKAVGLAALVLLIIWALDFGWW